jgi:hypothetical protein
VASASRRFIPGLSCEAPGSAAPHGDDQTLSMRGNDVQEGRRAGLHMAVPQDRAVLVEDADVHRPGVQVDATGRVMLWGGNSYELLWRRTGHPHGAMVKLLEACFPKKERFSDHSNPDPHDR